MHIVFVCLLACLLAACDSPSAKVTQFQFGTATTLATTGNLRLVTERPRPGPDGSLMPIVCTEPSPDYAIAFGSSGNANLNVAVPSGPTVGGGGAFTQTESATELKGRSAGVLALRDGLYAACQAYANGVIGHDAYAMILSQYGTLLVALVAEKPSTSADKTDPARRAALSALLVSCISEFDRTRLGAIPNTLLDAGFCRAVLRRSLAYGARNS